MMDARRYYSDLTTQYERYGGAAHGWHYGIWEPDVRSHRQALVRANEYVLRGLAVGPSTHILDVGFGSGGFAVWAASRLGARVTGISIVPDHVPLARRLADQCGVADRCDFQVMDMNALDFAPGRFDVVVNQETLCYASNKAGYLAAVYRALRPRGTWRAVDFSLQHQPREPWERKNYDAVCRGFHIPGLATAEEVAEMLAGAGFVDIESRDLTRSVLATAARIMRICYLPRLADRLHLGWTFRPWDESRANRVGHVDAAHHFSRGLHRGFCKTAYYSAHRPAAQA